MLSASRRAVQSYPRRNSFTDLAWGMNKMQYHRPVECTVEGVLSEWMNQQNIGLWHKRPLFVSCLKPTVSARYENWAPYIGVTLTCFFKYRPESFPFPCLSFCVAKPVWTIEKYKSLIFRQPFAVVLEFTNKCCGYIYIYVYIVECTDKLGILSNLS